MNENKTKRTSQRLESIWANKNCFSSNTVLSFKQTYIQKSLRVKEYTEKLPDS